MKLRFLIVFIFSLLLLSSFTVGQISYSLPQIADGGGYKTTFVFFNNGNTNSFGTLSFFDDSGNAFSINLIGLGDKAIHAIDLKPGETKFYQSNGQGPLTVGSARFSATAPIGVSAIFSVWDGANLVTEAGVGASEAVTSVAIPIDTMNGFHTGIAIALPTLSLGDYTFTLYDEGGNLLGSTQRKISPGGHLAIFVDGSGGLFPALGANMRGKLVVDGPAVFSAVALRLSGSLLTTMPAVPTSSTQTEFALPQIADGTSGSLGYKTQVILYNLKSTAANATVTFTDNSGNPFSVNLKDGTNGSTFARQIPANGIVFLETDASGNLNVGAARVTSDVAIGVTAIFSEMKNGTVATEAGVGDSAGNKEITLPFDQTLGFGTGVALFNLGNGPADVSFTVLDEDGNEQLIAGNRASSGFQLPINGHDAKFVNQIVDGVSGRGQMGVTSNQPLAAVVIRQGHGVITTLPVIDGIAGSGTGPGPGESTNLIPDQVTNVTLQGNTTLDRTLRSGVKLSGKVKFPASYFQTGAIEAHDGVGNSFVGFVNPIDGSYSMVVAPGTYDVRVCAVTSDDIPSFPFDEASSPLFTLNSGMFLTHLEGQVSVPADTVHNIDVDDVTPVTISGNVDNLGEIPDTAASLGVYVAFSSDQSRTQGLAKIEENGTYETQVAAGEYTASIYFAEGVDEDQDGIPDEFTSAASLYNIGSVAVSGAEIMDTTANLTVPNLVDLTGNVDQTGVATIPEDSSAFALDATFDLGSRLVQCYSVFGASFSPVDSDGDFSMPLISGRKYDVSANVPVTEIGTVKQGDIIAPLPGSNTRSYTDGDSTQSILIPALPGTVTISGVVKGPDGNPVKGVFVSASTLGGVNGVSNAIFSAGDSTDAQGKYSFPVLKGVNYTIDFLPPLDIFSGLPF